MRSFASIAFFMLSIFIISGCGNEDNPMIKKPPIVESSIPNYFPLTLDSSWEYQLSPSGDAITQKVAEGKKLIGYEYVNLAISSPYGPPIERLTRAAEEGIRYYVKDINTDVIREFKPIFSEQFPSAEVKVITPPLEILRIQYPLEVGRKWTFVRLETIIKYRREELRVIATITGQVVSQERITIPAGSFETYKLEFRSSVEERFNDKVEEFPSDKIDKIWLSENVGVVQFTFEGQLAQLIKYYISPKR